jgi:capsule biosynthesis phosphatase
MNIIIPIGGTGKRFEDEKYWLPKPLIKAHGKPIIFHLLDNLKIKENDILIIVYREEFNNFNFRQLLHKNYPEILFRFKEISFDTRGASETVLLGLSCLDDNEMEDTTIIIDSDVFFEEDILDTARNFSKNLIFYFKDVEEKPLYSYIKIDEKNKVLDIQEKVKISNNACAGAYCFSSSKILQSLIKEIIQKDEKVKGEFYISNLYKKLIYKNLEISSVEIKNFTCLGTPNQLFSFASNFNKPRHILRICFDLDNTLVTYPMVTNDYTSVLPIEKNIKKLQNYKKMGHYIIIYTARRMKTHNGNINNVISDIGKITFDTLDKFQIPYDEVHFGKPYADFYIDDLAINSFCDIDKEIGIYNIHTNPRLCNNIEVFENSIIKKSKNIDGEKYYYQNIPRDKQDMFPKLISCGDDFIEIEKINFVPFHFLFTNQILTENILSSFLQLVDELHNSNYNEKFTINIYGNYNKKMYDRFEQYSHLTDNKNNEIYIEIQKYLEEYEKNNLGIEGVIHGDLVFTNILINNKNDIKLIDMRGKILNALTIRGDIFYDYAKIYQSLVGYDYILCDKSIDVGYTTKLILFFENYIINKFGNKAMENIKYITSSFLLSLIPIHNGEKHEKYINLTKKVIK